MSATPIAEPSAETWRALVELAPDALLLVDPAGLIVLINAQAETLFGYDRRDLIGRPVEMLLPQRFQEGHAGHRAMFHRDPQARPMGTALELLGRRQDGGEFPAEISLIPIAAPQGLLVGCAIRDVTEARSFSAALVASSDDAIIGQRPDGVIVSWNPGAERIYGYTAAEATGRSIEMLEPPGGSALRGLLERAVSGEHVRHFEALHVCKEGKHIKVSLTISPVRTAAGRLIGVCSLARDVTPHKLLEEQIAQRNRELSETTAFLNNVLESSTEYAIIATDLAGNILSWNEGARRNYGYASEEAVGKMNWRALHAPEDLHSGRAQAVVDAVSRKWKAEGEFWCVRQDGTRFPAAVSITARRDVSSALIGLLWISKDISRQKALEEELRRKNEELGEQYRKAQEASRLKSEFLAGMSHELRTPLNAIIGFTELLHDAKVGPVSQRQKEFLGDVLASSRHLLQLIGDVLDLSKIEAGRMELRPEPVDLGRLVGEVRDVLRTLAAGKRIRVETEIVSLLGGAVLDPGKFKQVLYNFVSNALKFTPDEGRVTIRVKPDGPEAFRLEVEDTGIGIRAEDLQHLFQEFRQLDTGLAKRHPGSGLGLALTKRIVEAQGGKVGVHSTPGTGSVFFAVLPRAPKTKAAEPIAAPVLEPRPGAPTVLVIEDDAKDRAWLLRTLNGAGYAVVAATTGAEALALCRERPFDAITLDLLLPDTTGWEVLRAIRETGPNCDTPVVVVTVIAEKGIGAAFPIQDVLVKPLRADDLLDALQRAGVPADGAHTILVVDDNPRDLKLAGETLTLLGYKSICKLDAESGLAAAAEQHPAAVVLDLVMPGVDGFEFLRRFRKTPAGRHTPIIIWTSKDLAPEECAGLAALAQAVVLKGNGTSALLEEIQTWVRPS